jgi:hypothetical protein
MLFGLTCVAAGLGVALRGGFPGFAFDRNQSYFTKKTA